MNRKETITSSLNLSGLGLEVGPSHDPVAPKAGGYNVHIVDHLPQDELKAKYVGHGVNIDNIEPVDFVWAGQPLDELVGGKGIYDWIIASHVIEHVPDLIRFVRECQSILKPDGIISLAIPDRRYCFDYLRPASSTGQVIQAHLEGRIRHTPGQIFDSFSMATKLNGSIAWSKDSTGSLEFLHPPTFGNVMLDQYVKSDEYVDVHAWVFTPSSFRLIIRDLNELGFLNIQEESFHDSVGCEFFVSFRNAAFSGLEDRLLLAKAAQRESSGEDAHFADAQPVLPPAGRASRWFRRGNP